jgi:hypothetical protein
LSGRKRLEAAVQLTSRDDSSKHPEMARLDALDAAGADVDANGRSVEAAALIIEPKDAPV